MRRFPRPIGLFSQSTLHDWLQNSRKLLTREVFEWPPDDLLQASETDVVAHLVDKFKADIPVLHETRAEMEPVSERRINVIDRFTERQYEQVVTVLTLAIPFTGNADIFHLRPDRHMMRNWNAHVDKNGSEVLITWTGESGKSEAAKDGLDREIEYIKKHLAWADELISPYNASLPERARAEVAQRKAKLLADRGMEAALGFPVRRRTGPALYASSQVRRKVAPRPRPHTTEAFHPEPEFVRQDYEAALQVIKQTRNTLERTSSIAATAGEEEIRNLILVALNGVFEGKAGGEVFNGNGKTDILIREDDRNIFIGECKIWKGPKTITDALDQLLGYLVWRDTKAALLLFIRKGIPSDTIDKARSRIEAHPNFKDKGASHEGERYDYVFGSPQDQNRDIHLAFLPFFLPAEPKV